MDIERVDPQLRDATLRIPRLNPSRRSTRALIRLATRIMRVPRIASVTVRSVRSGPLRLRVYHPDSPRHDGGLLWIHGGGLLYGDARQDEALAAETAKELGIVVVSVNYRFAPEHPFPAAHDDVYASWIWLQQHAESLDVNPGRVVIGGESAGGGLAAALVQRLHDEGGAQPLAQWLFAPMIDDRTAADQSLDAIEHLVWSNRDNRIGWSGYLPDLYGSMAVSSYAAAARREDLSGLPRTYIAVGDIELFFSENHSYADRLRNAGVPVVLDVVQGAPHGFENWAQATSPAKRLLRRAREWLSAAFTE